ncbi:hypothetical protein ZHAS_00018595 [Anopheles sinensis]|uniref:Uncharacterized protein n=1 Tax=Anopheles sinensis TaxID=74873 RepID=A0A084WJD2_ANOSI|nr:hypothetical protein ZHAS_00018595 [Anopheles sinensis]
MVRKRNLRHSHVQEIDIALNVEAGRIITDRCVANRRSGGRMPEALPFEVELWQQPAWARRKLPGWKERAGSKILIALMHESRRKGGVEQGGCFVLSAQVLPLGAVFVRLATENDFVRRVKTKEIKEKQLASAWAGEKMPNGSKAQEERVFLTHGNASLDVSFQARTATFLHVSIIFERSSSSLVLIQCT